MKAANAILASLSAVTLTLSAAAEDVGIESDFEYAWQDGTCTWDVHGNEIRTNNPAHDAAIRHDLLRRSGFGR